jgi:hypothetical protein
LVAATRRVFQHMATSFSFRCWAVLVEEARQITPTAVAVAVAQY